MLSVDGSGSRNSTFRGGCGGLKCNKNLYFLCFEFESCLSRTRRHARAVHAAPTTRFSYIIQYPSRDASIRRHAIAGLRDVFA